MKLKIDPRMVNNSPDEAKELGAYLLSNDFEFLQKKGEHKPNDSLELEITHNLILDKENNDSNIKRYYVISNLPEHILGKGAFSKARQAIGYIDVDLKTGGVQFTKSDDKAVRIKNTQYAQKNRQAADETPYSHSEAVEDYQKSKEFEHIGMQSPVEVKKTHASLGLFSKSYSLMKNLKGQNLDDEIVDFINGADPDTHMIFKCAILPILEAYKTQLADKNLAHRDIKPENIRAYLAVMEKSIINFLDIDSAVKLGSADSTFGSPGYLPPELKNGVPVTQAREIFQLGVLLMALLNPALNPNNYLIDVLGAKNGEEAVKFALQEIKQNGCYDPDKMGCDLFEVITYSSHLSQVEEDDIRNEIKTLLKEMTAADPNNRPDFNTVLSKFKDILQKLEPPAPAPQKI